MKKGNLIKKYILELVSDGKEHSTTEIRDYILSKNIKLEQSSTIIRNVLFKLKQENPNLTNGSRGKYLLQLDSISLADNSSELQSAIYVIEKHLQEYKNFNWITCNDSQLNLARANAQRLITLASKINSAISC